ncbi:MAG: protoheme IX farnesyltransferase [Candidatus Rokubacteria bacterium RIFCSPLOWO2_02_FULL_73_56]|nr:MAG: protoheme IX farnesyltransferase [Candidatus Rokubacteria bacterium RIFCSPHIGHO2_02_FULL_73_26]OGL12632.1 MAG: protoheme IX farnesyltransferase [Candidatus Rokubacteria bacterium RIFCSPLOWO2_02_FULL_73_56]OGL30222.1 MAG: protoheme IX farnesyltransferase [Candidatus Rokubacteria bacterium RIFCSPLOWO2_12_FULL_73_47]
MLSAYVESLKLRIGIFIGMAAVLGYLATLRRAPSPGELALLFVTVVAAASGAGALNHYLDRDLDRLMRRTRHRPLASGRIAHPWHVVALGVALIVMAVAVALWALHPLVALHVFLGAFTYVVVYTVWLKRRTWLNVVIGGLAGSFAVLGGGSLARPELCLPPVIFATVLFFWSPTHFWSLGIAYKDEYAGARIPMLPAVAGEARAARSILVNTVGLVVTALLPVSLGLLGLTYAAAVALGSVYLVARNLQLVARPAERRLALHSFHASNLWLLLVFLGVVADVLGGGR